jgi:hypothetical protein
MQHVSALTKSHHQSLQNTTRFSQRCGEDSVLLSYDAASRAERQSTCTYTGWAKSPCTPVQERCCTVLQVGKSRIWNILGGILTCGTCLWVPLRTLSVTLSTVRYCDFGSNLYYTSDWCTGNFRLPCINHSNLRSYVAKSRLKPRKQKPATCPNFEADKYSPQLPAYFSKSILILSSRQ